MHQYRVSNNTGSWPSWLAPAASLLVWGAATASLMAWCLAFWPTDGKPLANTVVMSQAVGVGNAELPSTDLGKVLGASNSSEATEPAAPSLASRLVLHGIARSGADAVALIAVDGQSAKPFAKGAQVLPSLVLQSVSLQQISLGANLNSPVQLTLDMPLRAEPARGVDKQ